jgi:hypothetical protein
MIRTLHRFHWQEENGDGEPVIRGSAMRRMFAFRNAPLQPGEEMPEKWLPRVGDIEVRVIGANVEDSRDRIVTLALQIGDALCENTNARASEALAMLEDCYGKRSSAWGYEQVIARAIAALKGKG